MTSQRANGSTHLGNAWALPVPCAVVVNERAKDEEHEREEGTPEEATLHLDKPIDGLDRLSRFGQWLSRERLLLPAAPHPPTNRKSLPTPPSAQEDEHAPFTGKPKSIHSH